VAKKEIWEVILTKPAEKVYDKSGRDMRRRLDGCFEELEKSPRYGNNIKPLTGELKGLLRYRVGDWRIIILPRGNAYK
jgi:mRNA interferase RelE/StbE